LSRRRKSFLRRHRRYGSRGSFDRRWLALPIVPLIAVAAFLFRTDDEPTATNDVLVLVTGTQNETRPALPAEARELLLDNAVSTEHTKNDPPLATVLSVDGDGRTAAHDVDLTPRRGHRPDAPEEKSTSRRAVTAKANVDQVDRLVGDVVATTAGHSLLAGLQAAGRLPATTIVICSSGIDTSDPMDLRAFGFDSPPSQLVTFLRNADALPDLHGRDVYLALAPAHGPQQRLTLPIVRDLTALWTAIIEASGGTVHEVASASTAAAVSTVRTPAVPVPRLVTPANHRPTGPTNAPIRVELPAAALFRPDSMELIDRDATAREMRAVAERIVARAATVTIVGHTALDRDGLHGSPRLSLDRAKVIERILVQLGVPSRSIVRVTGVGATQPTRQPPTDPRNRVVVVMITPRR
jgi:flagellar motor protein MotB